MTPAGIEGPKNTDALIVISVKSAHHLAAMSAGKLAPNPNANFPSKNKLPSTTRPTPKNNEDFGFKSSAINSQESGEASISNLRSKIATLTCFF
jgi:hypothetical protein